MMSKRNDMIKPRSRFELIDTLRGFTLLNMIVYHALWDLVNLFGIRISWLDDILVYIWQQGICWTFLLISGFCFSLGHHHMLRGLTVFGCGAAITFVTCVFTPESQVIFGILTLIGMSMILLIPLEKWLRNVPAVVGLPICFGLFMMTRNFPKNGSFGFEKWNIVQLPETLRNGGYALMLLGFRNPEIHTSDYFPLIPWLFLFLTGYWLYQILKVPMSKMRIFHFGWRPLCFLGRHTLIIYMVHQPVLYVLFWTINQFI